MIELLSASIITLIIYSFITGFTLFLGGGLAFKILFGKKKPKGLSDIQIHNLQLKELSKINTCNTK